MSEIDAAIKKAMRDSNDYGEPWQRQEDGTVLNRYGNIAVCCRERIVACVNALTGRDPEKLEGLLEAVRYLIEQADYIDNAVGDSSAGDRCANALAAFEGRGDRE